MIIKFDFYALIFVQIFLHFVFVRVGVFPLTLAPFALVIFVLMFFNWRDVFSSRSGVICVLAVVSVPWLNAFWGAVDGLSFSQYLRTYALWVLSFGLMCSVWFMRPGRQIDLAGSSFFALLIVTFFVALQSITSAAGNYSFFNIFGEHQYFGEISLSTLAVDDRMRPPGFYLEPSFCAYVVMVQCAICMLQGRYVNISIASAGVALLFIQSLTGLIGFLLLLCVHFFCSQNIVGAKSNKKFSISVAFVFLILFGGGLIYFYGEYIESRADQVADVGSSTYYRVVGLLPILSDTLINRPIGWPLGSVKSIVPLYMVPHGTGYGESIDNGLYLLIFYFGWIGFGAILVLFLWLFSAIKNVNYSNSIGILTITLGCFFNGGIMLPEFSLMTVMVIYSMKWSELCKKSYQ